MYNAHRGMVPGAPNNRLTELLEGIRQEFDTEAGRATEYERQLHAQVQEMDLVRQKVFQLEQQHLALKAKYEEDITQLRRELEARGGASQSSHVGGSHVGPSQPPPPAIGHGPSNLFGGIMAGAAAHGGPGLAPPPQEQPQSQGLPGQMPHGPPGLNPAPGPPSHAPFPGYQPGPVNGEYPMNAPRTTVKLENPSYGQQAPQTTASPGPGKPRAGPGRGPVGPATPQQTQAAPYPGSPQVPRPTPPPQQSQVSRIPPQHPPSQQFEMRDVGNSLSDLDPERMPDELKRVGQDWFAIFNPKTRRVLDVDLVHTLPHQSVVCCVRFSADGRYVATGCNRSAQIFDVETGSLVTHLQDPNIPEDGDLYIRSVCFSPDGRFLATGAEDRIIRVWDIHSRSIKHQFTGHDQDIYSLDYSRNGRMIASGSGDRTVRLWDIENNQQMLSLQIEDGVTTVAISPDNRFVAAGSLDKSVRVWDTQTGYLVERLEGEVGHKDSVYSVAFAPNGTDIVSGSLDKTIKLWELSAPPRVVAGGGPRGGKCIRTFEGHKDFVLSVALTPNGQWVLSGSKDRGVQFWDPATGVAQLMLQGHKNSVISVAPGPSGNLFATGSGDMRARIWRYREYHGP